MAKYESEVKQVNAPVERVYAFLSNLDNLRPMIEGAADNPMLRQQLEEAGQDPSKLDSLKDVQLTPDRVSFPVPMLGEMALQVIEREENKCIKFETEQSPIEANLWIQVLPVTDMTSKMRLTLKADLNPMVKMMLGSKLEEGINKLADMLAMLPYNMMNPL